MKRKLHRWKRRLRYWFAAGDRQQLLREEMEFHIDQLARELMDRGITEQDARAAARRRFGNMTQQAEDSRGTWISRWMNDAVQDLRYTVRTLRREAGFTTFAILIAGLGIGASSTVFSVVNALLVRPLPFHDPARLVWIANSGAEGDLSSQTLRVSELLDARAHNRSFSELAAYSPFYAVGDRKLTGYGEPERLTAVPVSQNFFSLLGVTPLAGRLFTGDECKWNGPKAALLSYSLWQRRFARDPNIVGAKIVLNNEPVTVAGVMPEASDFASIFAPGTRVDLYVPFPLAPETDQWGNTLSLVGRLKPGADLRTAQAELDVIGKQYEREHPDRDAFGFRLSFLEDHISGRIRPAVFVLACSVAAVMLIVCANLSNLQLARTAARQKEMAVRMALGAGRQRLIRQMLTESITLSCCGAALGLLLAIAGTRVLARLDAISIPLLEHVRIDPVALAFTLLVAVATGLVFGLLPALHVPALAVNGALKESGRGTSDGKKHAWIRGALVVSEVAFCCVLLVSTGLLVRSFLRVLDVNLGFQPERAAALRIDPNEVYPNHEKRNAWFDEALRSVRAVPGIQAAGLTDVLPLGMNRSWDIGAKGRLYSAKQPPPPGFVRIVSEGYRQALGIPLRAGRDLSERDTLSAKPVVLVNESLARSLWPGENPIGKIVIGADQDREVVGVVGDVRHIALEQGSGNEVYIPIRQIWDYGNVELVVRTSLPPATLSSAIRNALGPLDPNLPANEIRTLEALVDKAVSPRRLLVLLLAGFSGFALILAALGIYGVISYSVNQRTQEIGIRMALGASARDLEGHIIAQTLSMAAIGILIGVAVSWILARAMSSLLFGVTATDPVAFGVMLIALTTVAITAGYIPARRASRIDPIIALRAD